MSVVVGSPLLSTAEVDPLMHYNHFFLCMHTYICVVFMIVFLRRAYTPSVFPS